MSNIHNASRQLNHLIEFVVKAMVGIVIVFLIAQTLITIVAGPQVGKIISIILSIALFFAVIVSKRVRDEILAFGHKH